jgi:hypothetical protein
LHPFSSLAGILAGTGTAAPAAAKSGTPAIADITAIAPIAAIAANGGRYFVRRPKPPAAGESQPAYLETLLTSDQLLDLGSPDAVLITAGHFPDRERMRPAFAALMRHEESADFPGMARLALAVPPVLDGVLRPNYLQASAAEEKRRAGEPPR